MKNRKRLIDGGEQWALRPIEVFDISNSFVFSMNLGTPLNEILENQKTWPEKRSLLWKAANAVVHCLHCKSFVISHFSFSQLIYYFCSLTFLFFSIIQKHNHRFGQI